MREQVKFLAQSRFEPSKPSPDSKAALERLPTIQGLENFGASSPRLSSISPLAPSPGFCPRTGFVAPQPPGCRRARGPRAICARDARPLRLERRGPRGTHRPSGAAWGRGAPSGAEPASWRPPCGDTSRPLPAAPQTLLPARAARRGEPGRAPPRGGARTLAQPRPCAPGRWGRVVRPLLPPPT